MYRRRQLSLGRLSFLANINRFVVCSFVAGSILAGETHADPIDLLTLDTPTDVAVSDRAAERVSLRSEKWAFLTTQKDHVDVDVSATVTIDEPATQFGFFGQSWSVWPDLTYGDQGFDAGLLLRSGKHDQPPGERGYRVQLSHKYQHVALIKYPDGGYLASVPCEVKLKRPHRIRVQMHGETIAVAVDGATRINVRDRFLPIAKGKVGIGASSGARVTFQDVTVGPVSNRPSTVGQVSNRPTIQNEKPQIETPPHDSHEPNFRIVPWIGERPWVFDDVEPIMLLPTPEERYINNVKLRPGFKPLLSWNSHWGIENQGAYPDGDNKSSAIETSGGGRTLEVRWAGRQKDGRFATRSAMTISFDRDRGTYRYDIDSTLEVLGDQPFHFRYGYDFEHHTPLDPFRWKHLMVRREGERLTYRPLSPFDPGGMENVEPYHGARIWHGRTSDDFHIAPVVEYAIDPKWNLVADDNGETRNRRLNTAVCAAFYDTGVSFAPETAPPGTKVRVKFAYTGYSARDAESFFTAAEIDDNPRNDPAHHFIFAREQWPSIRFSDFLSMDKPWWGGSPFMSGHNARPTYDLVELSSADRQLVEQVFNPPAAKFTHAMKLGPQAYGIASLAVPSPLPEGRYVVSAIVKSDNTHGPGGRIELLATERHDVNGFVRLSGKVLREETHYLGNGSFDWRRVAFVSQVPSGAAALALGLGNAGTGDLFVADVTFDRLDEGAAVPAGVLAAAQTTPPAAAPSLDGALFDLRMSEQANHHVYNDGNAATRVLELCNAQWTIDDGRPALRFTGLLPEDKQEAASFSRGGNLESTYLRHPSSEAGKRASFAVAGHHGGGREYSAFTLAAWIKPGQQMEPAYWGTDILGFGARRVKLILRNDKPPYALGVSLNFADYLMTDVTLDAGRWYHVAATGAATGDNKWLIRLYVDGREVLESKSDKIAAPMSMPESLILGCELFYLNSAYYHGLIGRTLVLDRALSPDEVARLAVEK